MRNMLRTLVISLSIVCLFATLFLSGCSNKPKPEQLQVLQETQKAAVASEDLLAKKQQEKADLENELAEKKQNLEELKAQKERIKSRLQSEE